MEDIIEKEEFDMSKFRDSLPEEVRNSEIIKNAKDIGSIAQMAVDSSGKVGQKLEEFLGSIPANGDSPEGATALDTVYSKLGWPGVDGKYEVTRPDKIDGLDYSEDREASFLEAAKGLKLNGNQVNALIKWQNEGEKAMLAKSLEEAKAADDQLRATWGDKYDVNKAEVKAILEKTAPAHVVKLFNETELGSDAKFTEWIHGGMSGILEKGALGHGEGGQGGVSKEQAQKDIMALYADTEGFMKVYGNTKDPGHKEAREKMYQLQLIINPNTAA